MNHSQLHAIDLAIIGAYLIAMIVIGLVVVRKIRNMDDYYLAGLPFGLGATVPGAIACAAALVIVSLATYKKSPSPFLDPYAAKT